MNNQKLIAPCGIECFNCRMYKPLSEETIVPADNETCSGCRVKNEKAGTINKEDVCEIYKCIQKKHLNFCSECNSFPCELLSPSEWNLSENDNKKRLINLCIIREMGIEEGIEKIKMEKNEIAGC